MWPPPRRAVVPLLWGLRCAAVALMGRVAQELGRRAAEPVAPSGSQPRAAPPRFPLGGGGGVLAPPQV